MRERTPAWIKCVGSTFNSLFLCSSSFLHDIPVYLKQDTRVSLVSYTESIFFRNLRLCIRWKLMLCTVGEDCHIRKVMEGKRGGREKFSSSRERVEYNWMFIIPRAFRHVVHMYFLLLLLPSLSPTLTLSSCAYHHTANTMCSIRLCADFKF